MKTGKTSTGKVLAFVLAVVLALSMFHAVFAAEISPATATIYIDGRATSLGDTLHTTHVHDSRFHYVELNALMEAFGLYVDSINEFPFECSTTGESFTAKWVSIPLASSQRGDVYTGTYRAGNHFNSDWSLSMSFEIVMVEEHHTVQPRTSVHHSTIALSSEDTELDMDLMVFRHQFGRYPHPVNIGADLFINFEAFCWLLDYTLTVDGNAIRVDTANTSLGIRPRTGTVVLDESESAPAPEQVSTITPETSPAATEQTTVYIDGRATNLGSTLRVYDGSHFVEVNAFAEAFGFPLTDNGERTIDNTGNNPVTTRRISFNVLASRRGDVYTGTRRPDVAEIVATTDYPWAINLGISALVSGEEEYRDRFWSMSLWFGAVMPDGGDEIFDGFAYRSFLDDDDVFAFPRSQIFGGDVYIPLEMASWFLDYEMNTDGNAVRIDTSGSAFPPRINAPPTPAQPPAIATPPAPTVIPDANEDISVTINGVPVIFDDQQPVIVDGRTLVPVRGVFETLGFYVTWDGDLQQAILTSDNYTVVITIGSEVFTTNGANHTLDVPAQVINDRTMIPIRLPLESVGFNLTWDGSTRTVIITN